MSPDDRPARTPDDGPAWGSLGPGGAEPRGALWFRLAGAVFLAVVSALMSASGLAILVTDGAAVGQDGAGWAEAASTLVFAGLAVVLARTALALRRQLRT